MKLLERFYSALLRRLIFFQDHIRDAGNGPTITLDVVSYMDWAGRYASPFQAEAISSFFDGSLELGAYASDVGDVVVSLQQLIIDQIVVPNQARRAISHYTTDMASSDFPERSYIFGSEAYTIPGGTLFRVMDGAMSVVGTVAVRRMIYGMRFGQPHEFTMVFV